MLMRRINVNFVICCARVLTRVLAPNSPKPFEYEGRMAYLGKGLVNNNGSVKSMAPANLYEPSRDVTLKRDAVLEATGREQFSRGRRARRFQGLRPIENADVSYRSRTKGDLGDRRDFGTGDRSKLAKGEGDWFHPAARGGAVVDAEAELAGAFPDAKSEVAAESAVVVVAPSPSSLCFRGRSWSDSVPPLDCLWWPTEIARSFRAVQSLCRM
ncbi:hypothetical protein NL676_006165 [Syzygium grande]|nr:hypothetical protein NL676_006165 [Syzygium grande]